MSKAENRLKLVFRFQESTSYEAFSPVSLYFLQTENSSLGYCLHGWNKEQGEGHRTSQLHKNNKMSH